MAAAGLVAGSHAILWQNGVPTNLGTLGAGSLAVAINNRGEVVGGSVLSDYSGIRGFLFGAARTGA